MPSGLQRPLPSAAAHSLCMGLHMPCTLGLARSTSPVALLTFGWTPLGSLFPSCKMPLTLCYFPFFKDQCPRQIFDHCLITSTCWGKHYIICK